MCYRCKVCDVVVPHGTPLLKHTIYRVVQSLFGNRPERQIAQEFPVCGDCKQDIDDGIDPRELQLAFQQQLRPTRVVTIPPVVTPSPRVIEVSGTPQTVKDLLSAGGKVQVKSGKPVSFGASNPKQGGK